MLLSFVVPCYRSENTVEGVISEIIHTVSESEDYDYEIIAVNDCSPDGVLFKLKKMAEQNRRIRVLDLATNVGKHGAILAGYSVVKGDYVIGVDDDGQCPLENLWKLIEPLNEGHDMSMAKYSIKKQSWLKNFGSKINSRMSQILLSKPEDLVFSNFIARKLFVCQAMAKYTNPYPYLEGLSLKVTRDIVLVPMEERPRISGTSGYTFRKSLSLWLNGFTAFSVKPLRIATVIGGCTAVAGILYGIYTIIQKILNPNILLGYSSLMVAQLFLSGILMMMLGMIGEYIGRIYICINKLPQYVIREKINIDEDV